MSWLRCTTINTIIIIINLLAPINACAIKNNQMLSQRFGCSNQRWHLYVMSLALHKLPALIYYVGCFLLLLQQRARTSLRRGEVMTRTTL